MKKILTYIVVVIALYPLAAIAQNNTARDFVLAMRKADKTHDWSDAQRLANRIRSPSAQIFLTWSRLRAEDGTWAQYKNFLRKHDDWPGLKRLRRAGESAIPKNAKPQDVIAYFKAQAPQTGHGAMRLAHAYLTRGQSELAEKTIVKGWTNLPLTDEEQDDIVLRFKKWVKPHHWTRTDNMLWQGEGKQAQAMLPFISAAQQKLARARIALRRGGAGVDALITTVPAQLRDHPGLAYDRFVWRIKKGKWDSAQELILHQTLKNNIGQAKPWAKRRRFFARRAMRAKHYKSAYTLAANHGLSSKDGYDYADCEWLAGFIALNYRKDAQRALVHFTRFANVVKGPISKGRAWYWVARAKEDSGDIAGANRAFKEAGKYETSFYGQLGAHNANMAGSSRLLEKQPNTSWKRASFAKSSVLGAAKILRDAGESPHVDWFLSHMAETMDNKELYQLAQFALEIDEHLAALGIAKEGAKRDRLLPSIYYPLNRYATYKGAVPAKIALSIIRQESEFHERAISSANAYGLMQLLSGTARDMAKTQGISYSRSRLLSDWRYNMRLGTTYLASLLERYNGSYILAFAAYNAGPHRVDKWIAEYGDPRRAGIDPIIWIEHIPFSETRNYVMRVMESVHVYKVRLSNETHKVTIAQDLKRG